MPHPFAHRPTAGHFHHLVQQAAARRQLVLQPAVGYSTVAGMTSTLSKLATTAWPLVGSLEVDTLTRVGQLAWVERALAAGHQLNGYPLVSHPRDQTRDMLAAVPSLPVQVRHGSAQPEAIFSLMQDLGLTAADGGPLSHGLAHGRTRIRSAINSWRTCLQQLATWQNRGIDFHLESHGGCLGGLLCPPSLKIALNLLEGMFFAHHGVDNISFSFAQGANLDQDLGALTALRQLATIYLPEVRSDIVVHTYLGALPQTDNGFHRLLEDAVGLASRGGAARLVIHPRGAPSPTPHELDKALGWAMQAACTPQQPRGGSRALNPAFRFAPHTRPREAGWTLSPRGSNFADIIVREACSIIEATRALHHNIDHALELAVTNGFIDIPGCLHPQNRGLTTIRYDRSGALLWADTGRLPFPTDLAARSHMRPNSLLASRLATEVATRYDRLYGVRERLLSPQSVPSASSSSRMQLQ